MENLTWAGPDPQEAAIESMAIQYSDLDRAEELLDQGLVEAAEPLFEAGISADEARAHVGLARCANLRGDAHTALGHLQVVRRACPGYPRLGNDMGVVFFKMGMVERAKKELESAAAATPHDTLPWRNLLDVARAENDEDLANRCCREILTRLPADLEALNTMGGR